MFEIARKKLNIDVWNVCEMETFFLFSRARTIAEIVFKKYSIDMW